jgi:lipopolysaccharide export system protein LptA
MKKIWHAISVFSFFSIMIPTAFAQGLQPKNNAPVEITADGSLEWSRNEKLFTARGNAMAKQADTSIMAETLTAHYRDGEKSGMDIHRVEADKNVELTSKDSTAYGQKADYDMDKGFAVMTGDNLKMVSPGRTVTATGRFEYWVNEGKLNAIGNARADTKNAKGETDTLQADTLSAILKDDAQGRRKLETLEAIGNVVITTPAEKITGQRGLYNARTNKATLTGNVVLHRGPNKLEGARAEIDMNTNISQLFGGDISRTKSGQVKGIFYPGSEKKSDGSPREIIPPSLVKVPTPSASPEKAPPAAEILPDDLENRPGMLTVP